MLASFAHITLGRHSRIYPVFIVFKRSARTYHGFITSDISRSECRCKTSLRSSEWELQSGRAREIVTITD